MFKFKDLSEDNDFKIEDHCIDAREFFEKRRTSKSAYVFDLRSSEEFEKENIPGSHSLPIEHFENSIYKMPFSGVILLYGGEDGEVLTAAEILYDNGFDSFHYTDPFEKLIKSIDSSYLSVSDEALKHLNDKLKFSEDHNIIEIKIEPTSPLKANYNLELRPSVVKGDIHFEINGISFITKRTTVSYIEGTIIEINKEGDLVVMNPNLSISKLTGSLEEQIQTLLEEQVNPMLASHGGNVVLEGIKDNAAYVRFGGGCQGCSMIDTTVKQGVEVMLKESIPELIGVFDITDHSEGESPFYTG